jgi:hypothetical protein
MVWLSADRRLRETTPLPDGREKQQVTVIQFSAPQLWHLRVSPRGL